MSDVLENDDSMQSSAQKNPTIESLFRGHVHPRESLEEEIRRACEDVESWEG